MTRSISPALKQQPYSPVQSSSLRYSPVVANPPSPTEKQDNMSLSRVSPSNALAADSASNANSDTIAAASSSKGKTIQALLKSLESKSKQELLGISKKMVSEINIKNRIINESKTNEKWILAQLAVAQNGAGVVVGDNATALQTKFSRSSATVEDKEFLQTLMAFKAELGSAKKKIEEVRACLHM